VVDLHPPGRDDRERVGLFALPHQNLAGGRAQRLQIRGQRREVFVADAGEHFQLREIRCADGVHVDPPPPR